MVIRWGANLQAAAAVVITTIKIMASVQLNSLESAYLLTYLLLCLRIILFCTQADIVFILQIKTSKA